jgi:hypothetical protein
MTKMSNIVEFRPGRRHVEIPLSLHVFRNRVQQYLHAITEIKEPLQDIYDLFRHGDDIWSDQCEYAINQLQIVYDPVEEFCQLLNTSTRLPPVVIPLRYPLVITLDNMNEILNSLIRLITRFSTVCQTQSKRTAMQRHVIESSLEKLIQESEDAKYRTQTLFDQVDQAHFPKHELSNG